MRIALFLLLPSVLGAADVNTLFARGRAALAAHDTDQARAYYSEACSGPGSATPFARAVCAHVDGVLDNSESRYRDALALWNQLAPGYPNFHATTLMCLADLLSGSRRPQEAEAFLAEAGGIAVDPALIAATRAHIGALYARSDRPGRGRPLLNEGIATLSKLDPAPKHELAYAWNALGSIDLAQGNYSAGEVGIRKALALEDKTEYENNLAAALNLEGEVEQAEILLRRVKTAMEAQYGPDSPEAATVLGNLAGVESTRGKFGTAEDFSEKALAIFRREDGADSLDAVAAEVNLAAIYLREHKTAQAARTMPDEARLSLLRSDPRLFSAGLYRLADLRAQQHRWKEADALYRQTIELYSERLGPNHPDLAGIRRDYAAMAKAGRLTRLG